MKAKRQRYTPEALMKVERRSLPFEGEWKALVGEPDATGTWIVWGNSANGKTRFCLLLAKYMAELGEKVAYVSLEEGASKSMQAAFEATCMRGVNRNVQLWCDMEMEDLRRELHKQRAPRVVIIDSLQYTGINYRGYKTFKEEFSDRLLVFVSHGNTHGDPLGACAVHVRYDAMVKIRVVSFKAFAKSRFGGGEPMTVWEEGALALPDGGEDAIMDKMAREE